MKTWTCVKDDELAPIEFRIAAAEGRLFVNTAIGWVSLSEDDFNGWRNGVAYAIEIKQMMQEHGL